MRSSTQSLSASAWQRLDDVSKAHRLDVHEGRDNVFEYSIRKSGTHTALAEEINRAAADGWEPVIVYAWNTAPNTADHAVLLRRPAPNTVECEVALIRRATVPRRPLSG